MTLSSIESSSAEFGRRGFEPSHLSMVPSSSGVGRKISVEVTTLPFVECDICMQHRQFPWRHRIESMETKNSNEIYKGCVLL